MHSNQSNHLDRRGFLNSAAVAGVATTVGFGIPQTARSQDRVAGANETVVVGFMGMNRGNQLSPLFAKQAGVRIKYVCDADSNRAERAVGRLKDTGQTPRPIGDFRTILDDPEVHALVCAAPNHWHAPATIMACAAGKHVYVEKPCSHNPAEGEWMVAAAEKHKRAVQMGAQRRSGPGTAEAMQRLKEGAIGRVYHARSWYSNDRGGIGSVTPGDPPPELDYELWQGPAPRRPFKSNVVHYNWHWNWHWGNGELANNGVHTIDLCRWGMDVGLPVRVMSAGGRYHFTDDQQTPDTQVVGFEFEGKQLMTWESMSCNRHSVNFVTFFGTEGSLDLKQDGTYLIYDDENNVVSETPSPGRGDDEHIANFLQAIRSDDPSILNAPILEGHKSTLLCHLGNIAHRTGRVLNCHPGTGRIIGDNTAMELWERDYEPGWQPEV